MKLRDLLEEDEKTIQIKVYDIEWESDDPEEFEDIPTECTLTVPSSVNLKDKKAIGLAIVKEFEITPKNWKVKKV